ncbi:hypothetical protein PSTT_00270 [Puccinia striiformis]|uniref:Uncharacterized protein n=1 Tax=Puccinia striiformis TaxID=27350 RepID=A0A2S4W7F0_9BASI|nr:hypothetical protein PSTT_00270 [Puccinia striiformis]
MSNSIKSTLLHVVFFVLAVSVVTVRSTCAEGYDFVACEVGGSYVAASPKTQNCIIGMKKCCDKDMVSFQTPSSQHLHTEQSWSEDSTCPPSRVVTFNARQKRNTPTADVCLPARAVGWEMAIRTTPISAS